MRFFANDIAEMSPTIKVRCDFWRITDKNRSKTADRGWIWANRPGFASQSADSTPG
jgi:hypothetical protein